MSTRTNPTLLRITAQAGVLAIGTMAALVGTTLLRASYGGSFAVFAGLSFLVALAVACAFVYSAVQIAAAKFVALMTAEYVVGTIAMFASLAMLNDFGKLPNQLARIMAPLFETFRV